jgi:hypothetical protein
MIKAWNWFFKERDSATVYASSGFYTTKEDALDTLQVGSDHITMLGKCEATEKLIEEDE